MSRSERQGSAVRSRPWTETAPPVLTVDARYGHGRIAGAWGSWPACVGTAQGAALAIGRGVQGASRHRGQGHGARNLVSGGSHRRRRDLADGLRGVFAASTRPQAAADRWRPTHAKVAPRLEK